MKTNLLTSKLRNRPGTQASSPAKIRLRWLFFFLLFLLLLALVASCKSPATLTNDTQHHTRDSNYHATVHRIETHDTIIIGPLRTPSISPLKGEYTKSPFKGDLEGREGQGGSKSPFKGDLEGQVLLRISDRKITIRDTVFIARTDTLLRTQTITKPQKYIPPFYRFCTISFVSFVSFVTLAFSIHLLFRNKLPRLSCKEGRG